MAADIQYSDAGKTLDILERDFLAPGTRTTYGALCVAIGYEPLKYARHGGQVCSLIDAACYWAKLPFLSLEKIRLDNEHYNNASFPGEWREIKNNFDCKCGKPCLGTRRHRANSRGIA